MCNFADTDYDVIKMLKQVQAEENRIKLAKQLSFQNAFADNKIIIISKENNSIIAEDGIWSISPEMKEVKGKQYVGINAKIETIHTVNLFKNHTNERCLMPISAFYDWKHYNNSKIKVKHRIHLKNEEISYLGCIYKEIQGIKCFTVVTTEANELMSEIHNTKMRMPLIFDWKNAQQFLKSEQIQDFAFPSYDPILIAENLEPEKVPQELF